MSIKKPHKKQGIWCRKNKTFYYLETGGLSVTNEQDTLRRTLIARGLIKYDVRGSFEHEEPYLRMTLAEAKNKNYEIEIIYLNNHIAKVIKDKKEKKEETFPGWK
jgi:hypothetical protein